MHKTKQLQRTLVLRPTGYYICIGLVQILLSDRAVNQATFQTPPSSSHFHVQRTTNSEQRTAQLGLGLTTVHKMLRKDFSSLATRWALGLQWTVSLARGR